MELLIDSRTKKIEFIFDILKLFLDSLILLLETFWKKEGLVGNRKIVTPGEKENRKTDCHQNSHRGPYKKTDVVIRASENCSVGKSPNQLFRVHLLMLSGRRTSNILTIRPFIE